MIKDPRQFFLGTFHVTDPQNPDYPGILNGQPSFPYEANETIWTVWAVPCPMSCGELLRRADVRPNGRIVEVMEKEWQEDGVYRGNAVKVDGVSLAACKQCKIWFWIPDDTEQFQLEEAAKWKTR